MKVALFVLVAVAVALQVQANPSADYDGVHAVQSVPRELAVRANCLLTAAGAVVTQTLTLVGVCLTEIEMLGACIIGGGAQIYDEVLLAYNDCAGNA